MGNYRTFVDSLLAHVPWLRQQYGEAFTTGFLALLADVIEEAANQAMKARFVLSDTVPDDALPHIGENVQLERYPLDTIDTYKARLAEAFTIWSQAGTRQGVLAALAASGFPGAQLIEDHEWDRQPKPYWSQFWIVFPDGTHNVTPSTAAYGDPGLRYGNGVLYGVQGITGEEIEGLRALAKKWKRAASILREMIFTDGGITYGTGASYGEPGLTYGGTQVVVGG